MSPAKAWGTIRASLEHKSFHDIKGFVGKAGLDLIALNGGWGGETMKFKENAFLWLLTGGGVIALLAAIDAEREPRGFFVAVRVVVCFASAYAAARAYRAKKEILTWLLGANAALYNPFVPVHLMREIWSIVDQADIVLLLVAAIVLRARQDRPA